jgi:hypothetical protein
MLCVNLKSRVRACGGVTGGISDIGLFDPSDFDWTQAVAVAGVQQPYTAVALRAGATAAAGAKVYILSFQYEEAEWTWKQSVKGCAVRYEHEIVAQMPENEQGLTTFLQSIDAAGCCCGLGLVVRLNSGKILVFGEKYVNATAIPRWVMKQDGSDGSSGKIMDDFNGGNIHLKGSYSRMPYEFTGAWSAIEALM